MKTCSNCGVALEDNMNFCPLCGEPNIDANTQNIDYIRLRKQKQEEKMLSPFQKLSFAQKCKLVWEISGILLLAGILISLIIDLIDGTLISWSRYSVAACAVMLINITLFCLWRPGLFWSMTGSFISVSAMLILFDIFDSNTGWGIKFGIPLLLIAYLIITVLVLIIKNAREKQLNLITYTLIAAGLLCICIEGLISIYHENILRLHWSLIVMICVVPVAALLFYLQYRLKKGTDLKRFFHI